MKPLPLSEAVNAFRGFNLSRPAVLPSQKFPDYVTGQRGKQPSTTPVSSSLALSEGERRVGSSTVDAHTLAGVTDGFSLLTSPGTHQPNPSQLYYLSESSQLRQSFSRIGSYMYSTPFTTLFDKYTASNGTSILIRSLLEHPEAPPPSKVLQRIMETIYPSFGCFQAVLAASMEVREAEGAARLFALYKRCEYLHRSDHHHELLDMLCRALLKANSYTLAEEVFSKIPDGAVTFASWQLLVHAFARQKLRSSDVFRRLVDLERFPVLASGQYGFSAELATTLLTKSRLGLLPSAPPLLGRQIIKRYVAFCKVRGISLHPTPFMIFFKSIRDTRTAEGGTHSSTPVMSWTVVWEDFQLLNRDCPNWYADHPMEAEKLCKFVVDVMLRGKNPWMVLNVARGMVRRHVVEGVDLSFHLLHRLSLLHHAEETRMIAGLLFEWLFDSMGVHLHPKYHKRLIPTAKVLLRLKLTSHLARLHNSILENVFLFNNEFRNELLAAMSDVMCPSCNQLLTETNPYVDRRCPMCMCSVPKQERAAPITIIEAPDEAAGVTYTPPNTQKDGPSVLSQKETPAEKSRRDRRMQHRRSMERSDIDAAINRIRDEKPTQRELLKKREEYRQQSQRRRRAQDDEEETGFLVPSTDDSHLRSSRRTKQLFDQSEKPRDAADLFQAQILDHTPFVPHTSVGAALRGETSLVPVEGRRSYLSARADSKEDVRALLDDVNSKLALQNRARDYAMKKRGAVQLSHGRQVGGQQLDGTGDAEESPSSLLQVSGLVDVVAAVPPTTQLRSGFRGHTVNLTTPLRKQAEDLAAATGEWSCVWCQQQNQSHASTVHCIACGAETGPKASWRAFVYAADGDVMVEIRERIRRSCGGIHAQGTGGMDDVVAAYYLLVYRRAFLFRARPDDYRLVEALIGHLSETHERVLAGIVYCRLIPSQMRSVDSAALHRLAVAFGTSGSEAFSSLTTASLRSDSGEYFTSVFGESTCKACFGDHKWEECPIVTRNFKTASDSMDGGSSPTDTSVSISASPSDRMRATMESIATQIRQVVAAKAAGVTTASALNAYKAFLSYRYREELANHFPVESNALCIMLSEEGHFRRAAYVICHVPLHLRDDDAYLSFAPHFGRTRDDLVPVFQRRSAKHIVDGSHPNVVQVTLTCCVCLEKEHPSFDCPKFAEWLDRCNQVYEQLHEQSITLKVPGGKAVGSTFYRDRVEQREDIARSLQLLHANINGWILSGPERLQAFCRFLLSAIDNMEATALKRFPGAFVSDTTFSGGDVAPERVFTKGECPIRQALNATVARLAETGHRAFAYRLFSRCPPQLIDSKHGLSAILRLSNASEADIQLVQQDAQVAALWSRTSAIPVDTHCMVCFESGHGFRQCPEIVGNVSWADRVTAIVSNLTSIRCNSDGVTAAADYIYDEYSRYRLGVESLRSHPEVASLLLQKLAIACFRSGETHRGFRVLRRIPIEMLEVRALRAFWKGAGCNQEQLASSVLRLQQFHAKYNLVPSITNPPPPMKKSVDLGRDFLNTVERGLCRHCYSSSHKASECALFLNEVAIGRDAAATFRMAIVHPQLTPLQGKIIIMRTVKFFLLHQHHVPYHVHGVCKAANGTAAFLAMIDEPAVALRLLLAIPAAYRMRHVFIHVLNAFKVPLDEVEQKMADFMTTGDSSYTSSSAHASSDDGDAVVTDNLVQYRLPIPDVAFESLFADIPNIRGELEVADEIILSHTDPAVVKKETDRRSKAMTAYRKAQSEYERDTEERRRAKEDPSGAASEELTIARHAPAKPKFGAVVINPLQRSSIHSLREAFDPIQVSVERVLGMKIGCRHILCQSAVELLDQEVSNQRAAPLEEADEEEAILEEVVSTDVPRNTHSERRDDSRRPHPNRDHRTAAAPYGNQHGDSRSNVRGHSQHGGKGARLDTRQSNSSRRDDRGVSDSRRGGFEGKRDSRERHDSNNRGVTRDTRDSRETRDRRDNRDTRSHHSARDKRDHRDGHDKRDHRDKRDRYDSRGRRD